MNLLCILCNIVIIRAAVIKEKCDGNNSTYDKELLKSELDGPYLLDVDRTTNTLYFSYTVNGTEDIFKTARLELDSNEFADLEIENGFTQTVANGSVYIGGSDGIYKYDHTNNRIEYYTEKNSNIWLVYYKDILYYSLFPDQVVYTTVDGNVTKFKELEDTKVDKLIIDRNDTIFYSNATGLYSQQKGTKDSVLYLKLETTVIRGLACDVHGDVFVSLHNGVYSVDKPTNSLSKIVDVDNCFGVAFDKDNNMIYSDKDSLVKLVKKC